MVQSQGEALAWHALSSSQAWAGACMVVGARAHPVRMDRHAASTAVTAWQPCSLTMTQLNSSRVTASNM